MKKGIFSGLLSVLLLISFLNVSTFISSAALQATMPPSGYDRVNNNIPHGQVSYINYQSKATNGHAELNLLPQDIQQLISTVLCTYCMGLEEMKMSGTTMGTTYNS